MTTQEFQREVLKHTDRPCVGKFKDVVDGYVKSRAKALKDVERLGVGNDGRYNAEVHLIKAFFRRWMMLLYPRVDLSFTESKRRVLLQRIKDDDGEESVKARFDYKGVADNPITELVVDLPNYVVEDVDLSFREPVSFTQSYADAVRFENGQRGKVSWRRMHVQASTTCPAGITPDHQARQYRFDAWKTMGIAQLIARGVDPYDLSGKRDSWGERINFESRSKVLWSPLDDNWRFTTMREMPRPKGDPAVIVGLLNDDWLLDFFDTPDEKSIENVIREFSEGCL